MAEKKGSSLSRDALGRVFDLIEGSEDDALTKPIEEVREELQRDGTDTTALKRVARERLAEIRAEAKLERARAERQKLDRLRETTRTVGAEAGPELRSRVLGRIRGMSDSKKEMAEVYYRRFESATDEDLLTLLEDIDLLNAADNEHDD